MINSLKSQAINGALWSFIERFSLQSIQFLITIIMARLLTPEDYGIIGMLSIFMSLSQVFIDGGFTSALVQRQKRTESDFSTVFYINMSISIICYFILYCLAPYIATFYNQPILSSVTRVYSLNLVINSLVAVNKTKLVIALNFKTQSKISLIAALFSGCIGIILAYNGFSVWALVIQMLFNSVFNVLLSFYYVKWYPKASFSISSFNNLFSFGSKLLLATIINTLYTNLYSLVIGKRFTSDKLGYYTRANQFANFASINMASILSRVSFPLLSQLQNDDNKLINVYSKYIQISAFIIFPIILGLGGIAKPLIILLLTEKWIDSVILLQILVFSYLWDCIILVNLNLLKVKGRTDLLLRLEISKKVIALLILCFTMFFGLKIICLGLVLYSCIAFYMNTLYTDKILNYGFKQQIKEVFPYFLFSIIISIEAYWLSEMIKLPMISILVSLCLCSLTYFILCYCFKCRPLFYLLDLMKQEVKKI